jgi:uncharacterized LabA/DUF88 family protein
MSQATPKPRSAELEAIRARVSALLPPERLCLVLAAAIERAKLERIVARSKARPEGPFARLSRDQLAGHAAQAYAAGDDVVFDVVRELDRATENERTIVSTMAPADVTSQFVTKGALAIKRHGAQLVWAVVRDDRLTMDEASGVVEAYVTAQASSEAPASDGEPAALPHVDISAVERERAHLVAEIGRREATLKLEAARSRELEATIARLEAALIQRDARSTPDAESQSTLRRLEKRIAHLEREAASASDLAAKLAEQENDNEQLKKTIASLRAARATSDKPAEPRGLPMASTASAAVLAALGTPLVEPPRRAITTAPPRPTGSASRIAVLVDVANIAGAARRLFERDVDYHKLLAECSSGRTLVEARAYVIDKGLPGIDAFTASLRQGGYKVQLKKPKTFADGNVKADWDMSIAIDALQLADRVDTVILVTGDGDFVPLVQGLKRKNVAMHAAAFPQRASSDLREAVESFIELSEGVLQ